MKPCAVCTDAALIADAISAFAADAATVRALATALKARLTGASAPAVRSGMARSGAAQTTLSFEGACSPQASATAHRGLTTVPAAPSSSSSSPEDLDLFEEQKTEHPKVPAGRVRPALEADLPDNFRRAYDKAVASRGVRLPSAEFVWAKYVARLWETEKDYATRSNMMRSWLTWLEYENPVAEADPTAGPSPAAPEPDLEAKRRARAEELQREEAAAIRREREEAALVASADVAAAFVGEFLSGTTRSSRPGLRPAFATQAFGVREQEARAPPLKAPSVA